MQVELYFPTPIVIGFGLMIGFVVLLLLMIGDHQNDRIRKLEKVLFTTDGTPAPETEAL